MISAPAKIENYNQLLEACSLLQASSEEIFGEDALPFSPFQLTGRHTKNPLQVSKKNSWQA